MNTAGHSRRTRREAVDLSDEVLADMLAPTTVRAEVVAQARARLKAAGPCPADQIAAELVDCYLGRRLP